MAGRPGARHPRAWVLAAALLAAVSPGRALAAAFADLGQHWAAPAVERMAAKGVARGVERGGKAVFEPDRPVTRWEALTMLVRALGWEEAARRRAAVPPAFREARTVPRWAVGYVAEAVERGLLSGPELSAFRGGERATRLQVAAWLVRALGLEGGDGGGGEAASGAPPFRDLGGLTASQARVVSQVAETGLMTGDQGRFRPADPVTRAEMAALLDRVDRLLDNAPDGREARGRVESTAGGQLVLGTATGRRTFALPGDAVVFYEGMRASPAFLAEGDTVDVVADAQGRARVVQVIVQPVSAEGDLVAVAAGGAGGGEVRLRLGDGTEKAYPLAPGCLVLLDDRPASLRRLAPGQHAVVEGADGAVTRIAAWSRLEEVRGALVAVARAEGGYQLQVRVAKPAGGAETQTFALPGTAGVTRDGRAAQPTDLREGDRVTVSLRGGRVAAVAAESYERELSGTLRGIRFGERVELTAEVARPGGSRVETYPVKEGAAVRKDGQPAGLTSLRPGDRVTLTVAGDDVTRVEAQTRRTAVEGTVVRITIANPPQVTVRVGSGEERTYPIADGVTVRLGDQPASLVSLRPGQAVTLSLADDQVVAIQGAAQAALDDLRGVVRYLDFQEDSFVLELADGRTRNVRVGSGFLVVRFGQVSDRLSRLEVGDAVIVVGKDAVGAPFEARVAVVVGTGR